jgi:hypothetical protein
MSLRPPEFEVSPDNPYERDTLGRRQRVEGLCDLIKQQETAAVVSVDGGFGTGKSVFLRMCAARLQAARVNVVEFNAWQQSHTKDPLVDMVSALAAASSSNTESLKQIVLGMARRVGASALGQVVGAATGGLVDLEGIVSAGGTVRSDRFAAWSEAEDQVARFKQALAELVNGGGGHLVVLVDELDRCLPAYAMELLNAARHLFDVPGVVIVLGVNRAELGHRVQKVYGQSCDADAYLRRFVDLPISLGDAPAEQIPTYIAGVFDAAKLDKRLTSGELEPALALRVGRPGASLRDIEQTAHHAAEIFSPAKGMPGWAWNRATIAMLLLRQIDRSLYEDFRAGRRDPFEVVKTLRSGLVPVLDTHVLQPSGLARMEVMLLYLADVRDLGSDKAEDFARRYAEVGLGDHSDAEKCLHELASLKNRLSGSGLSLRGVADRIELVAETRQLEAIELTKASSTNNLALRE